jgi:hypothetical protein
MFCPACGLAQPAEHRFCPSCGTRLPHELLNARPMKITRWFRSLPVGPGDPDFGAVRVTRYVQDYEIETAEGSVRVPSHHVRFSLWVDDRAVCALSIPDDEAERLAMFLLATARDQASEPVPGRSS